MKVCETIQQSLQHVKTSLGTAADKTSATVKKASEIALKILKAPINLITASYNSAKSLLGRIRKQPESLEGQESAGACTASPSLFEKCVHKVLTFYYTWKHQSKKSAQGGSPASLHPASLPVDQDGNSKEAARQYSFRSNSNFGQSVPVAGAQREVKKFPQAGGVRNPSSFSQGGSAAVWSPSSFQGGSQWEEELIYSIEMETDPQQKEMLEEMLRNYKRQNPS